MPEAEEEAGVIIVGFFVLNAGDSGISNGTVCESSSSTC